MTTNDSGPEPGTATADPQAPGAATAADGRTPRATWSLRLLGVALALLTWLLLGAAQELPPEARMVAAIGVMMATWWVTEAIPLSATALLPVVLWAVSSRWSGRARLPQELGLDGWTAALEAGLAPALVRSVLLGLAVAAVATPLGAWAGRLLGWRIARRRFTTVLVRTVTPG